MREQPRWVLILCCAIACCRFAWAQATPPNFEALFTRAALWQVGSNTSDVETARLELAALGEPAVRWLLDTKLDVSTTLEQRAFDDVITKRRDIAGPLVLAAVQRASTATQRINLARAVKLLQLSEAAPSIASWLAIGETDPETARRVLGGVLDALAKLDPETTVARAQALSAHADPWVRVSACAALGSTARASAAAPLVAIAGGNDGAIVRGAACSALITLGKPAIPAVRDRLVACSQPAVDMRACGFVVRAAVGLQNALDDAGLKSALDKVASLGPKELSSLTVALIDLGDDLSP